MTYSSGRRVLVTGITGNVGRRLLEKLDAEGTVEQVVGVDVREFTHPSKKLRYHRLDVREQSIADVFRENQVDTLVHLAFIMVPIHDRKKQRDVNINGSRNVLRAAAESGVRKIVYASSASTYGAHPDNPPLLTEDHPLRPNPKLQYAVEKVEVENELLDLCRKRPGLVGTSLRLGTIMGPSVRNIMANSLRRSVRRKTFFLLRKGAPMQFVHEDDVVEAFRRAVVEERPGVFNLVPDGVVTADLLRQRGYRVLVAHPKVAKFFAALIWHLRLYATDPATVDLLVHPWVVSSEKIKQEWGFKFKHSSIEALESTAAGGTR